MTWLLHPEKNLTISKECGWKSSLETFVPGKSRGSDVKDILHFKLLLTKILPSDGPPGPELPVGGLAVSLSGADHLQGGLEAVPQVPVRDQVIAVLLDIA